MCRSRFIQWLSAAFSALSSFVDEGPCLQAADSSWKLPPLARPVLVPRNVPWNPQKCFECFRWRWPIGSYHRHSNPSLRWHFWGSLRRQNTVRPNVPESNVGVYNQKNGHRSMFIFRVLYTHDVWNPTHDS